MFSDILQTELNAHRQQAMRGDYDVPHTPEDYEKVNQTISYKPEVSWNYEVGAHLNLFDHALHFDLGAFYMKVKNQQLSVRLEGVENLEYVIGMSAAISGMNSAVSLSRLEPMDGLCTVPMELEATGATSIGGRVLTFGHCHGSQQKQQHVLTIYTMLVDGSKYYFNYDVSGKMHEIEPEKPDDPEVPEGPAHIVIDIPKLRTACRSCLCPSTPTRRTLMPV